MNIKPIRNDQDLAHAFAQLQAVFQADEGTPEADEREVLVTLIEAYENKYYPIEHAEAVDAIIFQMENLNLSRKDLTPYLGSASKVSEVINRKRRLSLPMIRKLHEGLHIPYESLIH